MWAWICHQVNSVYSRNPIWVDVIPKDTIMIVGCKPSSRHISISSVLVCLYHIAEDDSEDCTSANSYALTPQTYK